VSMHKVYPALYCSEYWIIISTKHRSQRTIKHTEAKHNTD